MEMALLCLRNYQLEAVDAVKDAFDEHRSTMIVLPTGTGKTVVFCHIAKNMPSNKRVMIIAHREELIRQAAAKIETITGTPADIEMAGEWANEESLHKRAHVVVATVQTLQRRMDRFKPDQFGMLIIDENHHSTAKSYKNVINYFQQNPELKVLGVTATPDRTDEEALGQIYDSVAYNYEILDAIHDGWLVRVKAKQIFIEDLDFSGIHTLAGDFNQGELDELMQSEGALHGVADATVKEVGDRKTLLFCTTVKHAELVSEILNRHKPNSSRWVCGKTAKDVRAQTLLDYSEDKFQFLCNVGCFTEGFDEPKIECVVMARPTKSRSLYAQMAGRGTRPLPGIVDGIDEAEGRRLAILESDKPFVEIVDFAGNSGRHKLMTVADILGGKYTDEVQEMAAEAIKDAEDVTDVVEAMDEAAEKLARERREAAERKRQIALANRQKLIGRAQYETVVIDPFEALDITPKRDYGWNKGKTPTTKMLNMLRNNGVNTEGLIYTQCVQLIVKIKQRSADGLCGYVQALRLSEAGYNPDVSPIEASRTLRDIANAKRKEVAGCGL